MGDIFNSVTQNQTSQNTDDKKIIKYLSNLYIYTANTLDVNTIDTSHLKYENNEILINFDYIDDDDNNKYNYKGTYEIEENAIFINVRSEEDNDICLIILLNSKNFENDYSKKYFFSHGILLSYGRHTHCPEAKTLYVTQKPLNLTNATKLNDLILKELKKEPIIINDKFLSEINKNIRKI